ncbi:hypothetical protein D9M72_519390 [compost metagenome]
MSSADATPSSTMRMASRAMATPKRDEAKPGASLTTTAVLPSASTHLFAAAARSGDVCSPSTTSMSVDAGTGLKKCRPRKFPGRLSSRARPLTDSEDVLEAR